jgi:hypothetical protein
MRIHPDTTQIATQTLAWQLDTKDGQMEVNINDQRRLTLAHVTEVTDL